MKKKQWDLAPAEPYERTEGIIGAVIDLSLGRREPANEDERRLLKQIKEGEAKGYMLDLPLD